VNGAYLRDAVHAIKGRNVCVKLTSGSTPIIIAHPDDVGNESPQICMPMATAR
jgi:DNA polymerase III sliding clamp (beta) subunit (PCNA family)